MRSLVLLLCVVPAKPHAMWLTIGEKVVVRFSESPITTTRPGFDKGLANRTAANVSVKTATGTDALALTMGKDGSYNDLSAPSTLRDPAAVALVEGNGLKGMFEEVCVPMPRPMPTACSHFDRCTRKQHLTCTAPRPRRSSPTHSSTFGSALRSSTSMLTGITSTNALSIGFSSLCALWIPAHQSSRAW